MFESFLPCIIQEGRQSFSFPKENKNGNSNNSEHTYRCFFFVELIMFEFSYTNVLNHSTFINNTFVNFIENTTVLHDHYSQENINV